jgi:hypothetical protein
VAEVLHQGPRRAFAVLKVSYLLAVTAIAFIVPGISYTRPVQWIVIAALLATQVIILIACRVRAIELTRPVWRLKWLFVFLIAAYAFLPAENISDASLSWLAPGGWRLSINLTGLQQAALMCSQIITVLLASAVVRLTGKSNDFVDGLTAFRLPPLFVHSLDQTFELLGGMRRSGGDAVRSRGKGDGSGGGGGRSQHEHSGRFSFFAIVKRFLRGDKAAFAHAVQENIRVAVARSRKEGATHLTAAMAHDVAVVSGIALCMASIKILKFLPGVPFASGHKGFLLIPLYVLASRLTYSRWGGTAAGAIMGVIGFLQGDGRFGILEILKHLAPGVLIDVANPLMSRLPQRAIYYCVLGFAAAAASTITEFLVVFILGARAEVYLFPAARLVPNLLAGCLSGFVSIFILRAFQTSILSSPDNEKIEEAPLVGSVGGLTPQPNNPAGDQSDSMALRSASSKK